MLSTQLNMLEMTSSWSPIFYSKAYKSNNTVLLSDWVTFEKLFLCPTSSLSHSLLSLSQTGKQSKKKKKEAMDMVCWLSCRTKPNATLRWAWREAESLLCEKQLSVEELLLELCTFSTRKVTSRTGTLMGECTIRIYNLYRPCWKTLKCPPKRSRGWSI